MKEFDKLVAEHVRTLGGYVPGKATKQAERETGVRCIKMASNENPFGPSPRALEAIRRAAADVHLYPDNDVSELRQKLSERHGISADNILITAGSTSFLTLIGKTLLSPGLNAVTSERSFIIYPIVTKAAGARLIQVTTRRDGFDLEAILKTIDENTRLVFIANPNNPTGTLLTPAEIDNFVERVPSHVCVVIDEAYSDFAEYFAERQGVEYSHSLDHVRAGRNVVVLRTFSKAHGLAGARVGYGIAPTDLLQYFVRMKTVFSVTSMAEAGAIAALDDADHIRKSLENNAAGVKWLTGELRDLGLRVVPTWANFLYVDVGEDAMALGKRMQAEGIIIRPLSGGWGAPQAIRITIGTPEQNAKLVSVLKRVLEKTTVP